MAITRTLLLYRLLQYVLFPVTVLYFVARLVLRRHYLTRFGERLGKLPRSFSRTASGSIWLHAVSVGEVASAVPLLQQLRREHPGIPLYLSTTTIAGRKTARQQVANLADGIFYAPIDYVSCVRRTLRVIRPAVVVVLETEIWPNLFFEVVRNGARLALVNARISDRTWPRYYQYRSLFGPVLSLADLILVQSETDRNRYLELGARPPCLQIAGNLKYDSAATPGEPLRMPTWGAQQIWIAASTVGPNERGSLEAHDVDEDDIVLAAFQEVAQDFPRLLLIVAPRQPARFDVVARKLERAGIPFLRRTEVQGNAGLGLALPGVLLLDTIGELARLFALANVVFVGGSLAPRGGHNILEPAAAGRPIVIGPHMQNFAAIARDFRNSAAVLEVSSGLELAAAVAGLLADPQRAFVLGQRAAEVVRRNRGTVARLTEQIGQLHAAAFLKEHHGPFSRPLLALLAWAWQEGGVYKRRKGEALAATRSAIPRPVISIGGISVGGSGKTPFCDYLASELRARGGRPAILTRGYRRRSPAATIVLAAGAHVSTALTGDEAQIFLQSGHAVVGIGQDRYKDAEAVLAAWPETTVFLLDDGFQHAAMARNVDIVLIDGLDPVAGGAVVPLGRLREPLSALARADAFVITRTDDEVRRAAITDVLRRYNGTAPVFLASVRARQWRNFSGGQPVSLPAGTPIAAFCGLGNPQTFWNTLRALRLNVVFRWSFPDHHQYRPTDVQRLAHQARAHGAVALVTTEKDSMNLPGAVEGICEGLDLHWLRVDLTLQEPTAFFNFLAEALGDRIRIL